MGAMIDSTSMISAIFWAASALLIYELIVYPVLMRIISSSSTPAVHPEPEDLPAVSLIIPAHNEQLCIQAKLENALALDYPRDKLEIVVASDGSSDRTVELARKYEGETVRVLDLQPNRGKAAALNAAVAESRGEVLCLCDANVMFRSDSLRRMVVRLADDTVGAVSGDVRLASNESDFEIGEAIYYRVERPVQLGESRIGSMMGADGGMYLIRRELFQPLPTDTILDDFVTSMRVIQQRRRIVYEPAAIAVENGTPSWRQEFRRRVRVMVGAVQSLKRREWPPVARPVEMWQYASHKLLRWFGPVWLMLLLLSSILLWGEGWIFRVALLAQLATYGLAAGATWSATLRRTRLGGISFYFAMSHVAMAAGLAKGLFARPTGVWERTERVRPETVEGTETHLSAGARA